VTAVRELEERLEEAIHALTERAIQDCNLVVSRGPLAPLTGVQNVAMRVALSNVMRTAIAAGRTHERALRALRPIPPLPREHTVIVHPDATTPDNPSFSDDETTRPMRRSAPGWKAPDLGDQ